MITRPGETILGELKLVAHARQSYDVILKLTAPPINPGGEMQVSEGIFDLKEPYYRQLVTGAGWYTADPVQGGAVMENGNGI